MLDLGLCMYTSDEGQCVWHAQAQASVLCLCVRFALQHNNYTRLEAAPWAAGAVFEAANRAAGRRARGSKESPELQRLVRELTVEVQAVVQGGSGPAVRCAAIEALLWTQVPRSSTRFPSSRCPQSMHCLQCCCHMLPSLWHVDTHDRQRS